MVGPYAVFGIGLDFGVADFVAQFLLLFCPRQSGAVKMDDGWISEQEISLIHKCIFLDTWFKSMSFWLYRTSIVRVSSYD